MNHVVIMLSSCCHISFCTLCHGNKKQSYGSGRRDCGSESGGRKEGQGGRGGEVTRVTKRSH